MTTGTLKIDQLFPQDGPEVKTGIIDRVAYASDASHYLYTPKAVIEARSAEHVAAIFKAGRQQGIPVTLRSGGTSLAGQASGEGYLVDVRKHFRGIEILDDGKRVRVQPGATVRQVNARLGLRNRKLGPDPASEAACTIGGVVANNSSGMACGTEFNTYNTLESLTFVLPSGTVINTADADADRQFQAQEPELVDTLTRLQRRVRDNQESVDIIRRHFQLKNTMGYGLNSFLDFDSPVKLFEHLLVGSEGTLAFIAEAVFRTVHISSLTTTTVAVFNNLSAATKALPSLVETGAATLELMDSASIRVGQGFDKVPQAITGFDVDSQAALLIEYQSDDKEELREKRTRARPFCTNWTCNRQRNFLPIFPPAPPRGISARACMPRWQKRGPQEPRRSWKTLWCRWAIWPILVPPCRSFLPAILTTMRSFSATRKTAISTSF